MGRFFASQHEIELALTTQACAYHYKIAQIADAPAIPMNVIRYMDHNHHAGVLFYLHATMLSDRELVTSQFGDMLGLRRLVDGSAQRQHVMP